MDIAVGEEAYLAAGMTVVLRKLAQCADRTVRGRRPGRVPVTARLQLLPAQLRASRTPAEARERVRERAARSFILCVGMGYCRERVKVRLPRLLR